MAVDWTHAWSPALAAFLASLVEFIEASTVVLAVGAVRGWRDALIGAVAALFALLALVLVLGPAIERIPLRWAQVFVGALLLLFGMRWLRKAILRAAGVIPLHDENAAYLKETEALRRLGAKGGRLDTIAVATTFKITMIEGLEVVFIVIAVGAGGPGLILPASLGAVVALALVASAGALLHRPIAAIPENALKFSVGVLLSAFGAFWIGEGAGLRWFGEDWAIPGLVVAYLAVAFCAVRIVGSRGRALQAQEDRPST